jgi:hypothetical protein
MPAGSADFDRANNVEQVVWANIPAGPVTVTVSAHRVTLGPKNFALVIRVQGANHGAVLSRFGY